MKEHGIEHERATAKVNSFWVLKVIVKASTYIDTNFVLSDNFVGFFLIR